MKSFGGARVLCRQGLEVQSISLIPEKIYSVYEARDGRIQMPFQEWINGIIEDCNIKNTTLCSDQRLWSGRKVNYAYMIKRALKMVHCSHSTSRREIVMRR